LLLYYITDRTHFNGNESSRRRALLDKIGEAARNGIDLIQLREKDLSARELESLARNAVSIVRSYEPERSRTRFLINSRVDVAVACGADGVQLRSDDVSPHLVRLMWDRAATTVKTENPTIGVSCHTDAEVNAAISEGADFALFAPIFEKRSMPKAPEIGLAALQEACTVQGQVLALGGITIENARSCLDAGAAGIAGIRLFQEHDISEVVKSLRGLSPSTFSRS
jgi:thiamine-phosphate pyrophosphorylase